MCAELDTHDTTHCRETLEEWKAKGIDLDLASRNERGLPANSGVTLSQSVMSYTNFRL